MYISKVTIKSFRNLESLSVDLDNGLNVIVGENNAGKTNLLDALRVALGSVLTGDLIRVTESDLFHDKEGTRADLIRIDIEFSGLSDDDQAEMIEILNYDPTTPANSKASIHAEFRWFSKTKKFRIKKWGGGREDAESGVPEDVSQSIQITLLNALRDATNALSPGRQNRLGRLLTRSASSQDEEDVRQIIKDANRSLEKNSFIQKVEGRIAATLQGTAGPKLAQDPVIRSSEPQFERIVNNLRLVLRNSSIPEGLWGNYEELGTNGLGYNNLLYIATVLSELLIAEDATLPLLLVEEPEAHLHPQLQILLADFLANSGKGSQNKTNVQTIVTTHSPTIASHVDPNIIRVLHETPKGQTCVSIGSCGLSARESNQLGRMLDATRATLLFAKGIILVEGICEVLLVPVLSRRLGINLEQAGVSVIPVCGVDFDTFGKLYGNEKLQTRMAIVTDGDPGLGGSTVAVGEFNLSVPLMNADGELEQSARTQKVYSDYNGNPCVSVFTSKVTFEYDLADAGPNNPETMSTAWVRCHAGKPRKLNLEVLKQAGNDQMTRTLLVWNAVCDKNASASKGEFAQSLAEILDEKDGQSQYIVKDFEVPQYLKNAIAYAAGG